MAGSRNFKLSTISRKVYLLLEKWAQVSGMPFIMDSYRAEAEEILDAWITISEQIDWFG
jgi:hypothetical protein